MISAFKWWWGLLLAFGLLAVSRLFLPLPFLNEVIVFSIYTMGCNFLLGRLNFISFGQPAYLAAGAYATAFYLVYFGTNPFVGVVCGIFGGIVVSLVLGPLFFLALLFVYWFLLLFSRTLCCTFLLWRLNFCSFCQPASLAAGAYATAFYLFYFVTNPFVGVVCGIFGGIVVSLVVEPFFVRLLGDYFAMVNLALAAIFFYLTEKTLVGITNEIGREHV